MNLKKFSRTLNVAVLGIATMLGFTVATAQAQYRDNNRDWGYSQESWSRDRTREYAFRLGYHSAYSEARDARDTGFHGSPRDLPGYRNDGNGFLNRMNYLDDYRSAYRRGFEEGARDAFSGRERRFGRAEVEQVLGQRLRDAYPSNEDDRDYRDRDYRDYPDRDYRDYPWRGNDSGYRNGGRWNVQAIAQQNGYRDGLRRGEEDRFRGRGFGYQMSSEYRRALNGYRSEFGNPERYQEVYREAFRRGYMEALRRGDNRGRW